MFWESHPNLYGNTAVAVIVAGVFFVLSCIIVPLAQPWTLTVIEFLKTIPIPRILLNDRLVRWICDGVHTFFDHRIVFDGMDEKTFSNKRLIKCLSPHGIIPFSACCLYDKPGFEKSRNTFAAGHQLYNFPLLIQLLEFMQVIPVNYDLMKSSLALNNSLVLYPGGVREIFATDHRKEILAIKRRRGVFRMALETGTPMVPVYTFGMTVLHERSGVSVTLPFFFNNEKDTIAMYYGKYYTLFPMRKRLVTVVGEVVPVEKTEAPTEGQIKTLRKKYKKAVRNLFEKWKRAYDPEWSTRRLVFR